MKHAILAIILMFAGSSVSAQTFKSQVGNVSFASVPESKVISLPYLTWGGDVPMFIANGGLNTNDTSEFGKIGLNVKLVNGDNFTQQVRDYISGKCPYLRCTTDMLAWTSDLIKDNENLKPVIFLQLSWSMGDHVVARDSIKNLNDIKGKKVAITPFSRHVGFLDDSLKLANLKWEDVEIVWSENPVLLMRNDTTIDAVCVNTYEMIGLCSGIEYKGSGAEGTLKGAYVINSTSTMSETIADVYVVRNDYYKKHSLELQKILIGYLKSCEYLISWKNEYNNGQGKSENYVKLLHYMREIYGKSLMLSDSEIHLFISDAKLARVHGNESFLMDKSNPNSLLANNNNANEMATRLGICSNNIIWNTPTIDYKLLSKSVGVKYIQPKFSEKNKNTK